MSRTRLICRAYDGSSENGNSTSPKLSDFGSHMAFRSTASNLVLDDRGSMNDIYLQEFAGITTRCVSVNSSGNEANDESRGFDVGADGNLVVFASLANNLVYGDDNSST